MRICLVSQEYPPETAHGGIATQTRAKAHGLAALGHDVVVLSHAVGPAATDAVDGLVRVVRRPAGPTSPSSEIARWVQRSLDVASGLRRLEEEEPLDIVDVPDYGAEGFVHLVDRDRGDRPPTVLHAHGSLAMLASGLGWPDVDSDLHRVGTVLEGTCARRADAVFGSSALSARWCADERGVRPERVPVLHAGVDTTTFRPDAAARAGRPTVAFVGRVARSKGADVLAKAAIDVARDVRDLVVRFVGRAEGTLAAELSAAAAEAGRPDLFAFEGVLSRERVARLLASAHVFAAPSPWEAGPGFVVLEAMACGLPAIACSGSGVSASVRDGVDGRLVPPGDVAALAEALRTLLRDADLRAALGTAARRRIEAEADAVRCVGRIAAFYESVASTVERG